MTDESTGGSSRDERANDSLWEAGLRAGFGPNSTAAYLGGGGGVLAAIDESSGAGSRILLRDEPDGPDGLVNPRSAEIPAALGGIGRYQVAGEIARGGVGVVLRGRDVDLGREIALKVLRAEHAANPVMIRRLVEEAQIGGQLQHPGVLPVYEMGLDSAQRPYFAMKLVRGRTLAAQLQDRLDPAHDRHGFLTIFLQVCQTIAYAHARGVIHRDLKPANVMVGSFGEVQVVDWGLAKVLAQGGVADERRARPSQAEPEAEAVATIRSGNSASQSEAGSVLGTPAYMAPEQARGEIDELDERCDVFALGAILCEILTGRAPYNGNRAEVLRQAREGSLDDGFAKLDACGAETELITIAKRCLDPARDARFRDASHLARELSGHMASVADRVRTAEIAAAKAEARALGERRARRLTVALSGVILVSGLVVMAFALYAEHSRAGAAFESQRADAEYARQVQAALALVGTLGSKGLWIMSQAQNAPQADAEKWAKAIKLTREAVEKTDLLANDPPTRQRREQLLSELRAAEAQQLQRAERAKSDRTSTPVTSEPR
jgi:eukaryotic-like serine/threonine-protein kinase